MLQGGRCPWSSDLSDFSNYLYQECNIPCREPNWRTMSLSILLLRQLLWAADISGKLQLSWPGVEETILQSLLEKSLRMMRAGKTQPGQQSQSSAVSLSEISQQLKRMLIASVRTTLEGALPAGGWHQWLLKQEVQILYCWVLAL